MKISCSCGAFFYSHLQKDITDFMKAHSVCEESVEPPAVTRAREILEECGIVDVQGTPADQLRPLVEVIEKNQRLSEMVCPVREPDVTMVVGTGSVEFNPSVWHFASGTKFNCFLMKEPK